MKRPIAIAGASILGTAVLLTFAIGGRGRAFAQAETPIAKKHFLEVGKTYTFTERGQERAKGWKILEEPRDGWVKVSIPDDGRGESTAYRMDEPRLLHCDHHGIACLLRGRGCELLVMRSYRSHSSL